ncbi:mitochondrial potassium channel-like [Ptychodera flava]|uniref:mitochondrial potassium channel-like n=1 Tax=Ptychodera flava TaxID=63121 RepID=UPI00396AA92E
MRIVKVTPVHRGLSRNMGSLIRRFDMKKLAYVPVNKVPTITGNSDIDAKLLKLTGGRIEQWVENYEHFLGITEIREAQLKVTEAKKTFDDIRKMVRTSAEELENLQTELRTLRGKIERIPREDRRYLELATEEHRLLQMEKQVKDWQKKVVEDERNAFEQLTVSVRESHEKERARAERTKYWSIIGSVTGTVLGVFGSTLITRYRMKEIRNLLEEAKEDSRAAVAAADAAAAAAAAATDTTPVTTAAAVVTADSLSKEDLEQLQSKVEEMQGFVKDLQTSISQNDVNKISGAISGVTQRQGESFSKLEKNLAERFASQEKTLTQELKGVKKLLAAQAIETNGSGVSRPRILEDLLDNTEEKLEWQMKMSTLSTVVFIYGAFALTLPILYSIFK